MIGRTIYEKNRIISALCALLILCPSIMTQAADEKEIQVWYDEYTDITELYRYEEYSSEYKTWCSGYLQLKTVREANGRYLVTYTGVLQGTI